MYKPEPKIPRRQQILTALASMLHTSPGERITTAALAKAVGVSEAALYRHFPSKTKMFEGLIEFIEESVFSRITVILADEKSTHKRCEKIIAALLEFAEQNPGLSRLLSGDALTGETERLRLRIAQFFERIENQLRQLLRDAELRNDVRCALPVAALAQLLMAYVDGCIAQFVRSEFQRLPSPHWPAQWQVLAAGLLSADLVDA